jgi:hypothetical protein
MIDPKRVGAEEYLASLQRVLGQLSVAA